MKTLSPTEYREKLSIQYAKKYGIDSATFLAVSKCENTEANPTLQSRYIYTLSQEMRHPEWNIKAGEREQSFGLWQIHLPDHKDISLQQATDPEWSTEWAAKEFAKGRASQWSCFGILAK